MLPYMQECAEPVLGHKPTNGDLVNHIKELRFTVRLCNADKAALRVWANLGK